VTAASRVRLCAIAAFALLLAGCSSAGGFAGAAAAFATSVATANPVIGISVGIGVKAAVDQGISYAAKRGQRDEHAAIVAAAQDLKPGERGRWSNAHLVGSGFERGEVRVVRAIETPLATCKELLFSVEREGAKPRIDWFTTTACRNADGWQWAAAEPAVERWGNLQ
jgi:hypothetical protein